MARNKAAMRLRNAETSAGASQEVYYRSMSDNLRASVHTSLSICCRQRLSDCVVDPFSLQSSGSVGEQDNYDMQARNTTEHSFQGRYRLTLSLRGFHQGERSGVRRVVRLSALRTDI